MAQAEQESAALEQALQDAEMDRQTEIADILANEAAKIAALEEAERLEDEAEMVRSVSI